MGSTNLIILGEQREVLQASVVSVVPVDRRSRIVVQRGASAREEYLCGGGGCSPARGGAGGRSDMPAQVVERAAATANGETPGADDRAAQ